jgi:RHS repeat-associated protein
MDNIVTKSSEHGDYQFTYDDLYRLMTADNPILNDEEYTYDQVGNRLTASGVTDEWSYNANNELQGYDDVSYEYDENGSITQKTVGSVVTKFFYNIEGRLERVEDGSSNVIAEYYYDPFGRRLWKEVGGSTLFFQYADEGLVAEYDGTGTEIKTYGYKPGSTWTTDPLFMKEGAEYYFYHNDHLGTPQKMTAVNGAVVWGAQYEAFGKASVDGSSTIINNLRFPGQYFDQETGLHYNFHRYYDPVSGRYFRVDPVGFEGGINVFNYVRGNPINFIDKLGLWEWPFEIRNDFERIKLHNPPYRPGLGWYPDPGFEDPNIWSSFGFTIFAVTFDWVLEDGCKYFCLGTATEVFGIGASTKPITNFGSGSCVSLYAGVWKHLSFSGEVSIIRNKDNSVFMPWLNPSASVGASAFSSPVGLSLKYQCWPLNENETDENGCPCENKKPKDFMDILNYLEELFNKK